MANASSAVSDGMTATAAQYNNLRDDAIGPYGDERVFPDNIPLKFGTGEDTAMYYDGTDLWIDTAVVGSGLLRVHKTASSTDSILDVLAVRRSTSGTAAVGLGARVILELEDDGGGFYSGVGMAAVTKTAPNGSADADWVLYTATNETLNEVLRVGWDSYITHTSRNRNGSPGTTAALARFIGNTFTDNVNSGTVTDVFRQWEWEQMTLSASSAVTYDDVAMLVVGRPVAGTNVTFTRHWALWTDGRINIDDSQDVSYSDANLASFHTGGGISANKSIWTREVMALSEMAAPTGQSNIAKIYALDNGGKTELHVIFGSGASQLIAAEP